MATYKGKEWLHRLWKEQNGECPVCHQKMTRRTGWHSHRILWRSKGGPDTQENRVFLHPTCHQQVHSQGLSVTKPRPTDKKGRQKGLSRMNEKSSCPVLRGRDDGNIILLLDQ